MKKKKLVNEEGLEFEDLGSSCIIKLILLEKLYELSVLINNNNK